MSSTRLTKPTSIIRRILFEEYCSLPGACRPTCTHQHLMIASVAFHSLSSPFLRLPRNPINASSPRKPNSNNTPPADSSEPRSVSRSAHTKSSCGSSKHPEDCFPPRTPVNSVNLESLIKLLYARPVHCKCEFLNSKKSQRESHPVCSV